MSSLLRLIRVCRRVWSVSIEYFSGNSHRCSPLYLFHFSPRLNYERQCLPSGATNLSVFPCPVSLPDTDSLLGWEFIPFSLQTKYACSPTENFPHRCSFLWKV